MSQQPAAIMGSLISRINNAWETRSLTPASLAAFEEEAQKLRAADVAEGEIVLGILAAHRGDLQEMRKRFRNAREFNAPQYLVDWNFGLSLFICGDFSGAVQVLAPYMEKDKDCALFVACACKYLGLDAKAAQLFESLGVDEAEYGKEAAELASRRISFIAPALESVQNSFEEDKEIWQSLSKR